MKSISARQKRSEAILGARLFACQWKGVLPLRFRPCVTWCISPDGSGHQRLAILALESEDRFSCYDSHRDERLDGPVRHAPAEGREPGETFVARDLRSAHFGTGRDKRPCSERHASRWARTGPNPTKEHRRKRSGGHRRCGGVA